ncbi:MAG TPA: hypothetical protein VG099_09185 [Gemmataceae bacterium]|jgi:hypothetical protein|nr:hypothetical protein [Gemmataceae bacterium]
MATVMLSIHKAQLSSMGFRGLRQEFGNFFKECHMLPCVWQATLANLGQAPRLKKRGKLANSFFCWTQLDMRHWFADETKFANRGKLTWQTGKLNGRLGALQ